MSLRSILVIPDERLRTVATPVSDVTPEIRKQVEDMFETMYDAPGIGLAAPQIGVLNRVIVVDCGVPTDDEESSSSRERAEAASNDDDPESSDEKPKRDPDPIAMINPEIIWQSEETSVYEEGCLSIPEYYEDVERPAACMVRYQDLDGKVQERQCEGLLSTCVQHEIDHLDGKLFIDYLSRLKRERIVKRFQKLARRAS